MLFGFEILSELFGYHNTDILHSKGKTKIL